MSRSLKIIVSAFAGLLVAFGAFWASIGPDWRALISDPPMNRDLLFWSQSQRDTSFRLLDRIPFISRSSWVADGEFTIPLPDGEPLLQEMDLQAYIDQNRVAGLVVLHNGRVRMEAYGLGFDRDERWTSFSVAKSLTSTLVGAAIQDGYINSLDDDITTYISDLDGSAYEGVSVRQLLTMTSGVAWNEDYEDPESDVAKIGSHESEDDTPNLVSYMSKLPRAHAPGEVWNYSTGETNLIGILVMEATNKSLSSYLSEKVWVPFGMEAKASWLLGSDGIEVSGCCIQARTRDFARFGQFVLEDGIIDGQRTVPQGWFDAATVNQVTVEDQRYGDRGYGFQWWIEGQEGSQFAALGIFGQSIFIDADRDLVIAINSSWTSAVGHRDHEGDARDEFHKTVQAAIDAESAR